MLITLAYALTHEIICIKEINTEDCTVFQLKKHVLKFLKNGIELWQINLLLDGSILDLSHTFTSHDENATLSVGITNITTEVEPIMVNFDYYHHNDMNEMYLYSRQLFRLYVYSNCDVSVIKRIVEHSIYPSKPFKFVYYDRRCEEVEWEESDNVFDVLINKSDPGEGIFEIGTHGY